VGALEREPGEGAAGRGERADPQDGAVDAGGVELAVGGEHEAREARRGRGAGHGCLPGLIAVRR
jgi:hypothetical protein